MSTTEARVHDIWRRELKLEDFSDQDDFFDLGGHSLIMASIQASIADDLGVEVPMDELFRRSTVTEIAERIDELLALEGSH